MRAFIEGSLKISLKYQSLLLIFCKRMFRFILMMIVKSPLIFLKNALISAPIIQPPDWNLPFEIMCDTSDYAIGAVLGQHVDKKLNFIYYASKTLDGAQINYATTEK